jgi:hypothetical protein
MTGQDLRAMPRSSEWQTIEFRHSQVVFPCEFAETGLHLRRQLMTSERFSKSALITRITIDTWPNEAKESARAPDT